MTNTPKTPIDHISFQRVLDIEIAVVGAEMIGLTVAFQAGEDSRAKGLPETVRFVIPTAEAERFAHSILKAARLTGDSSDSKAH